MTKEKTESEAEEKDIRDYEQLISDSEEKRATDSKALTANNNATVQRRSTTSS